VDDLLGVSYNSTNQANEGKNALDFFNDIGGITFNHNSAPK